MPATYFVGDAIEVMGKLPENSVDLVLTSPPFLALRSYLPADHPDKALEGGSQSTPGEFIDWLLDVVEACDRVLAPHGSLCIELGDTYSGSGGGGGDYLEGGWREGQAQFAGSAASMKESNAAHWRLKNPPRRTAEESRLGVDPKNRGNTSRGTPAGGAWPLAKSLSLIPETFRFAMVYGRNPHTGRTTDPWRLRNVIRWVRPNPPVGALCVDDQTEALTLDGWKTHDQLSDGDLVASYDLKTDSIRFLPAKFVRYEVEGESMVAIDKRSTSQRLTEWHRCLVRTRKGGVQVKLAQDLTNESQTLLCAPFDDVAGPAPVTTERAALLGWYIAEGTPHHRQARIVQSVSANPEKVEQIRRLLDRDGADYRQTFYTRPGSTMATFTIKGELAEWLNLHHKRLPMSYVTTWPQAQAQALFDALIDGDGHRRKSRGVLFHQQNESVADAVQVLAIRLGYRASKSWQPSMNLWQITMSMAPIQDRRWTKIRKWDGEGVPREVYTGTVWCPQVETGFWLARRKGKTFITGNSDKFRPATSELMVFCKSAKRYFDLDAVREPHSAASVARVAYGNVGLTEKSLTGPPTSVHVSQKAMEDGFQMNPAGAPPLDWWNIPPGGYEGAHYAVWPPELCVKPVKAMCPEKVCRVCGEPSRRIVEVDGLRGHDFLGGNRNNDRDTGLHGVRTTMPEITRTTLGFSDCGHDDWRPGVVLDPFAGSGTTLAVATGHGRDAIGIDLDERNLDLALERVGPFMLTRG